MDVLWTTPARARCTTLLAHNCLLAREARHSSASRSLLQVRLIVESAFVDALRLREGLPCEEAWPPSNGLRRDSTGRAVMGTNPECRIEKSSFFSVSNGLAQLLNLNPDELRQHGLQRISGFGHRSDCWLPGLPGIHAYWQNARGRVRSNRSHQTQPTQPLNQRPKERLQVMYTRLRVLAVVRQRASLLNARNPVGNGL